MCWQHLRWTRQLPPPGLRRNLTACTVAPDREKNMSER